MRNKMLEGWVVVLLGVVALAASAGPPEAQVRGAFRMILAEADKNKDGKLSMAECKAMFNEPKVAQEKCGFWDVNRDGTITEDEYVKQVAQVTAR